MTLDQIREYIDANGGEREYLINWEGAYLPPMTRSSGFSIILRPHCDIVDFIPHNQTQIIQIYIAPCFVSLISPKRHVISRRLLVKRT